MVEVAATLATILLFLWTIASSPREESCARGWWIPEGVRRTGEFTCRPSPRGVTERDARGILRDQSVQPPGAVRMRVYCADDEDAVALDDGRTVACRRRTR